MANRQRPPGGPSRAQPRASLLDRLIDTSSDEGETLGTQSEPDLRESVRRDLAFLLSTRRSTSAPSRAARERSVYDYGVQDFLHLSPKSDEDRQHMAAVIKEAVEAFEPRLAQVQVRVELHTDEEIREHPERIEALVIYIGGYLMIDAVLEAVSFPFVVRR